MLAFVSINCLLVTKLIRLLIGLPFFQLLACVWISWHCYCYLVMSLMAGINFSLVVGEVQGLKLQVHLADVSTGGAFFSY